MTADTRASVYAARGLSKLALAAARAAAKALKETTRQATPTK